MTAELNIKTRFGSTRVLIGEGLLAKTGALIGARGAPRKVAVVSDETVAKLYLAGVEASLKDEGFETLAVVVPAGETSKSFAMLEKVCAQLLDFSLERSDCLVALGGGVIGDLAGLAASLLRRGVNFINLPTTLLAQVDSSIGGKTAINTRHGKNLVGTFYPPGLVISDTLTLQTLPGRQLSAGYAEVIKHAILDGENHFSFLEATVENFFAGDAAIRKETITKSAHLKAGIVERDELEQDTRMTLNLGHSFGHALEGIAAYDDTLLHGEAVALGLMLAFQYAGFKGVEIEKDQARVTRLLDLAGLPTTLKEAGLKPTSEEMLTYMLQDKKRRAGGMCLVVPHGIGDVAIEEVDTESLDQFLQTVNT